MEGLIFATESTTLWVLDLDEWSLQKQIDLQHF